MKNNKDDEINFKQFEYEVYASETDVALLDREDNETIYLRDEGELFNLFSIINRDMVKTISYIDKISDNRILGYNILMKDNTKFTLEYL
jgi:hypothetical protein